MSKMFRLKRSKQTGSGQSSTFVAATKPAAIQAGSQATAQAKAQIVASSSKTTESKADKLPLPSDILTGASVVSKGDTKYSGVKVWGRDGDYKGNYQPCEPHTECDKDGYGKDGYDRYGYDRHGYGKDGCDKDGFRRDGYDRDGYGRDGYNKSGYDRDGHGKDGYDRSGYGKDGCDRDGYDKDGYDKHGHGKSGYDRSGYSKDGYNKNGYDRSGRHRDGYNKDGCDKFGYNREGYDTQGYDRYGYNKDGYGKDGYNKDGYGRDNRHKNGSYKVGCEPKAPYCPPPLSCVPLPIKYKHNAGPWLSICDLFEAWKFSKCAATRQVAGGLLREASNLNAQQYLCLEGVRCFAPYFEVFCTSKQSKTELTISDVHKKNHECWEAGHSPKDCDDYHDCNKEGHDPKDCGKRKVTLTDLVLYSKDMPTSWVVYPFGCDRVPLCLNTCAKIRFDVYAYACKPERRSDCRTKGDGPDIYIEDSCDEKAGVCIGQSACARSKGDSKDHKDHKDSKDHKD
jgi:hypothetical protein